MSDGILEGLTVVVTGVGPGLGRETAQAALREGANVAVAARSEDRLRDIAAELDPSGERVLCQPTDIGDRDAARALIDATVARFGRLDAVVQCAAIDTVFGGLEGADFADLDRVLRTNLYGTLYVLDAATPHLEAAGGSFVIIGAQTSIAGSQLQLFYAASKGALTSASRHLAVELGRKGIRINTVVPGWMYGPPVEGWIRSRAEREGVSEEEVLAFVTQRMALGRMATDGDVAEAAIFFASPKSKGTTGQTLLVNGGEVMQ